MEEIVIPIVAITTLFGVIPGIAAYVIISYYKARNKERMLMIEKGINPLEFEGAVNKNNKKSTLTQGLLMAGVGLGFLTGYLLSHVMGEQDLIAQMVINFALVFAFGGTALMLGHYLEQKNKKENLL